MSDPLIDPEDKAGTLLTSEEREGLIPTYITTRAELNEAEQINIDDGVGWALARERDVLDEALLKQLHKRMYGQVWRWAGEYRKTEKNIGIDWWRIEPDLKALLDDTCYWVGNKTYPPDELAVRFHHRLVFIHPFPNGNGRHSRLAADMLVMKLGKPRFTWGGGSLVTVSELRNRYVAALQEADRHNIEPLLIFARS